MSNVHTLIILLHQTPRMPNMSWGHRALRPEDLALTSLTVEQPGKWKEEKLWE